MVHFEQLKTQRLQIMRQKENIVEQQSVFEQQ